MKRQVWRHLIAVSVLTLLLLGSVYGGAVAATGSLPVVRIKDISRVQGVRENQLVGLGLVVGLNGTGDGSGSQANVQMVANMLHQFGIQVDPYSLRLRNAAAVMVTASLPPFARTGDTIDVTVASVGDASSLEGGVLLQTPLRAANGQVYAVAQGPLLMGGQSGPGGRNQRTRSVVARVPNGAIVEQAVTSEFLNGDKVTFVLNTPDFATASRVSQAINRAVAPGTAIALDSSGIQVTVPPEYLSNPVEFLAALEQIPVSPDAPARVVINERTGTVIIGAAVRVAPVAVSHGNLSVRIYQASQAIPQGSVEDTDLIWEEPDILPEQADQTALLSGSTVEDVIAGLNAIGATPKDVISILQAIRSAGALYGELVVI